MKLMLNLHTFNINTLQVHQAVIDAGETESGCTIHQVTETVDGGPVVVQKKVRVRNTNA